MAKAKASPKSKAESAPPTEVAIKYDLFDLPTAFHKAGLAGLLLLTDWMKSTNKLSSDEVQCVVTPTTAEIVFTESLVQKLMDEVYNAEVKEVEVKSKWPSAKLKEERIVEKIVDGKTTKTKRFVYDSVEPRGEFLRDKYPDHEGLWLKLWRNMLWSIPRGKPATRIPYKQRSEDQPCGEGSAGWTDLVKAQKARSKNAFHTVEISSALLLGAQAVNAESVPFEGRAEQNLLLHFWPLAVLLYVPQVVESDGSTVFAGYTIAVPEVSNLEEFQNDYPRLLSQLDSASRGYRPAGAIIDLPAEGGLALLNQLAMIANLKFESGELRFCVGGVEYMHLVKEGNNIKTMASGRVSPDKDLLMGYREIVDPQGKSPRYRNSLFRRGLLVALLDGEEWHQPFGRVLSKFDAKLFIRKLRKFGDEEKQGQPQFADDAAKKFRHVTDLFARKLERMKMTSDAELLETPLPLIVNRVVRNYLRNRTKERTGIDPDKYKSADGKIDYQALPTQFNDDKRKLALGLILEFRSRRDQAFVDHFMTTFFSITQRMSDSDRLTLAKVLMKSADDASRDDLKTLTLLSLSANS